MPTRSGDLLVNALYGVYQKGHPNFEEKYITMLKAGGTLHHKDLLAPFGLDASRAGLLANRY
jgi:oligoendopeptidase F